MHDGWACFRVRLRLPAKRRPQPATNIAENLRQIIMKMTPLDLRHVAVKMIQFILKRTPVGPLLGDRAARTKYLQQMR